MDTRPPAAVAAGFCTSKYILVFPMRNLLLFSVLAFLSCFFSETSKGQASSVVKFVCDQMSDTRPNSWSLSPRERCYKQNNIPYNGPNQPIYNNPSSTTPYTGPTSGPYQCSDLWDGHPLSTLDTFKVCYVELKAWCHRFNNMKIVDRHWYRYDYLGRQYLTRHVSCVRR